MPYSGSTDEHPTTTPERDGHIAELDDESTTTSELLQQHLGEARRYRDMV